MAKRGATLSNNRCRLHTDALDRHNRSKRRDWRRPISHEAGRSTENSALRAGMADASLEMLLGVERSGEHA